MLYGHQVSAPPWSMHAQNLKAHILVLNLQVACVHQAFTIIATDNITETTTTPSFAKLSGSPAFPYMIPCQEGLTMFQTLSKSLLAG